MKWNDANLQQRLLTLDLAKVAISQVPMEAVVANFDGKTHFIVFQREFCTILFLFFFGLISVKSSLMMMMVLTAPWLTPCFLRFLITIIKFRKT